MTTSSQIKQAQMDKALLILSKNPNKTSKEIAVDTGCGRHFIARRLPDLRKADLASNPEMRKCKVSSVSKPSFVWQITNKGMERLKILQK